MVAKLLQEAHRHPGADGCWTRRPYGSRVATAYTRIRDPDTGQMFSAHRLVYAWQAGWTPPKGLMVMHRCDNPPCYRPDHLVLGDALTNSHDMLDKGRHFLHGARICRRGLHERTLDNLYTNKQGIQLCRECMRERQRRVRANRRRREAESL